VFSEKIKAAVKEVVGDETNPYLKVKKIFEWININFPWASAREYSTIPNIPEYVLANRHGDCGQVSLLFITMARCAGVPAKWQSGWMMHPGNKNLHDWAEVYYDGKGWVPVDQSFGRIAGAPDDDSYYFFTKGLDAYRMIVNQGISGNFYPAKIHPRSETVDFQRGEVEWKGENLYFGRWRYKMEIEYLK
jgi:transglutaminase-like putative cysteine protease